MSSHTHRDYEQELERLRTHLVDMAREVQGSVDDAMHAFLKSDITLAERTLARERSINRRELEIDEASLILLARWQPLAADLRFVAVVLKIVTDLERIGDLAKNLCQQTALLSKFKQSPLPVLFLDMTATIRKMLRLSVEAFSERDKNKAQQVLDEDEVMDEMYHQFMRNYLTTVRQGEESGENTEVLIYIQAVAKWLERMGDHCTNVAEHVIFWDSGTDIRHGGKR